MTPFDNPPYDREEEEDMPDDSPLNEDDLEIIELGAEDLVEDDEEREEEAEEEEIDDSLVIFRKHKDSVFCGTLCGKLAVTGGGDDIAYVWDVESGEVVFNTGNDHRDSVTHCLFSTCGTMVATGDMAGLVIVWKVPSGEKLATFDLDSDLRWLTWHPHRSGLMAGVDTGDAWWMGAKSGQMAASFPGHGCDTTCAEIFENGTRAVICHADGILKLWDLKTLAPAFTMGPPETGAGILCVSVSPDSKLVLAGYKEDGSARLYSTKNGKLLATWGPTDIEATDPLDVAVESVSFSPNNQVLAVARLLGLIRIYDISTKNLRVSISLPVYLVKVVWDGTLLYVPSVERVIYVYDSRSGEPRGELRGHSGGPVMDLVVSPDGEKVLSVGEDGTSRVFAGIR